MRIGSDVQLKTWTVAVYFSPPEAGTITGTLTVATNGYLSNRTTFALQSQAASLAITGKLEFGKDLLDTAVTKSVTVTGATTYSSVALTGDTTGFTISSNTCAGKVAMSCVIQVKVDPQTIGAKKAALVIKDSYSTSPQKVAATGTGTEVSLSPATLAFGAVTSGTKKKTVTVKNVGTTPLTFRVTPIVTGTGSAQFQVLPYASPSTTCLNGSVTLTQNQTCTFTVKFTSTGGIVYDTDLNIVDNGGASPQLEKMTATD